MATAMIVCAGCGRSHTHREVWQHVKCVRPSAQNLGAHEHVGVNDNNSVVSVNNGDCGTKYIRHHLYRHFDKNGILLYVGVSMSAFARLVQHQRTAHWFDQIASVTIENFSSRSELMDAEWSAIAAENPLHNIYRPRAILREETTAILSSEDDAVDPNDFMSVLSRNTSDLWLSGYGRCSDHQLIPITNRTRNEYMCKYMASRRADAAKQ